MNEITAAIELATKRIVEAVKSAMDSASSSAASAASVATTSSSAQILGVAVLNAKFDGHEKEDERRFEDVKDAFISAADNVDSLRQEQKTQTRTITLIIGGLIVLINIPVIFAVIHFANAATK